VGRQVRTGNPWEAYLHEDTGSAAPESPPFPDQRSGDVQAGGREVLPQEPWGDLKAQLCGPPRRVLGCVRI
jgi:hypothetical protein